MYGKLFSLFVFLSLSVFFSGCSSDEVPTPKLYAQGGFSTFTLPEDTETSLIKDPSSMIKFCGARESDAVSAKQNGFSLGFGIGGAQESVGATNGGGALSLGGRDPLVLITREFLYRVCELSLNHNLNKQETIELYKYFIEKLLVMAPLTKADGAASAGIAPVAPTSSEKSSKSKDDTKDDIFDDKSGF
ncbi:MAG: hypothetical protein IBX44_03775 [Sulfurospirillum sp.]|nr:hypothetical protein [Sulfurospirillum sp.]